MSDEAGEDDKAEAAGGEARDEEAQAPRDEAPRPKRRKKRRAVEAEEAGEDAPAEAPTPAPADERPAFARGFPADPALDALVAAFEAGDYARVRREAPALARATESDDVRRAARELRRRLDPDPAAVYLLGIAAVLLAFLAGWYWMHARGSLP